MLWQCWAFVGIMSDLYLAAWPILRPFFKQIEKQDQEQTCHPAKPKLTMLAIASDLRVRTKKNLSAPLVRADFPEKCGYSLPYHFPGLSMGTFHFSLTESTVANQPAGCSGGHNGHSAHNGDAHDPNCTGDVPGHSIYHSGYIVSLETYIFKYHMGIGIGGGKVSMDLRDHDIIIQWDIMGYNI